MTLASDRLRPIPATLPTEGQVLAAVESIVQSPVSHGQNTAAVVAQSGLLAISIPAAFDGADISNIVVAEAISQLAIWDKRTTKLLVQHLTALELLRNSGTDEQRRAVFSRILLGEVFHFSVDSAVYPMPRLARSGLSFVVEPAPSMPPLQGVDWHILVAAAAGMGEVAAILSYEDRQLPGGDGLPIASPVSPDNVLVLQPDALPLSALMQAMLHAAICRGILEAQLGKDSARDVTVPAVEFELLDAIVLKAASIFDGIQVDLPPLDQPRIERLCKAMETACIRCSDEVTPRQ